MTLDRANAHDLVARLAHSSGEATWLTEIRHQALDAFVQLPFPEWDRRTKPQDFPLDALAPSPGAGVSSIEPGTGCLPGVVYSDLFTAIRTHPDLVRKHLGQVIRPSESKFAALHYALLNSGVFVYVPPEVDAAMPVRTAWSLRDDQVDSFAHTLVVVGRGARLRMVEVEESCPAYARLACHLVEVVAGEGASVQYAGLQSWSGATSHYAARRSRLASGATAEWVVGVLGGGLGRDTTEAWLEGEGSECGSLVMFFGTGEQHLDLSVEMRHTGQHTTSDIMARGVLQDRARAICRGNTYIEHGACFSNAFQRQNTMLLSKEARTDAIPELQINEEEIHAGHAATVGQVDDGQLFYLMSRGLTRKAATRLIVNGFLEPILQRIPLAETKELVQSLIDRKMNA